MTCGSRDAVRIVIDGHLGPSTSMAIALNNRTLARKLVEALEFAITSSGRIDTYRLRLLN